MSNATGTLVQRSWQGVARHMDRLFLVTGMPKRQGKMWKGGNVGNVEMGAVPGLDLSNIQSRTNNWRSHLPDKSGNVDYYLCWKPIATGLQVDLKPTERIFYRLTSSSQYLNGARILKSRSGKRVAVPFGSRYNRL